MFHGSEIYRTARPAAPKNRPLALHGAPATLTFHGMTKLLPAVFALNCSGDCWLATAPVHDRGRRTFERFALQL
jgi:hypothetical protein